MSILNIFSGAIVEISTVYMVLKVISRKCRCRFTSSMSENVNVM